MSKIFAQRHTTKKCGLCSPGLLNLTFHILSNTALLAYQCFAAHRTRQHLHFGVHPGEKKNYIRSHHIWPNSLAWGLRRSYSSTGEDQPLCMWDERENSASFALPISRLLITTYSLVKDWQWAIWSWWKNDLISGEKFVYRSLCSHRHDACSVGRNWSGQTSTGTPGHSSQDADTITAKRVTFILCETVCCRKQTLVHD